MKRFAVLVGLSMLGALGCSDEVTTSCDGANCAPGGSGQGGDGGQGAQGGQGGQGAQGGQGGDGGQGGATVCGGFAGTTCGPNEFCDYQPSTCGVADGSGTCKPRPMACPEIAQPTCGCDGVVYGNECEAQAAGVDASYAGGCTPPDPSQFPCGPGFCDLATQYCQRAVSDVGGLDDGFACMALPNGCAECGCLTSEPCGDMCSGDGATGIMLTCPGG